MAQVFRNTVDTVYRKVFSCCRNALYADKDVAVLTHAGRPFQARDTATENEQSPCVDRLAGMTTSLSMTTTTLSISRSTIQRRLLARYDGAVSWR